MNRFTPATICSLLLLFACGGASTDDTAGASASDDQTQLVAGDSVWTYGTDDVVATTTCSNWEFDCDEPNTTCELDISDADNDGFSAMDSTFSCSLTGDSFSCTGVYSQETDAMGDGSAMVLTDTTEPYGEVLSASELNIVLPISLSCEGDGCGPVDAAMSTPCSITLDITATLSAD
ncbi:MAG: hypothetical protein QGG40_06140 [Myxococcota bacterium]|nr:hypothetical protein [Myxococcota bacterium]